MTAGVDEGLLLVDKPPGWTSHDVVAAVRRRLPKGTKVGHTGTLDPMATGLLILLLGPATKRAQELQGLPKVYSGRIRLGVETDTGDATGKIIRTKTPPPALKEDELSALFSRLVGRRILPVPRYSAVKMAGRPLYSYARSGETIPEVKREMEVTSWVLTAWDPPEVGFRLACASGTYVRSLAELVGREIGCGATLSALRRESIAAWQVPETGPFDPHTFTHALQA